MASLTELYKIAILLSPVISSLFAILILLLDISSSSKKPLKLSYYLLAYFFAISLSWLSAILYFYAPKVYVSINCISMLVFILTQVFYYGFIFEVTRTNEQEKFSILNYLFPVLLSFLLLVVSLIIPYQDQLETIIAKGKYVGGSKLFFYLNYSKIVIRLSFSLIYTLFGFRRLLTYHRFIRNFSSNEEKSALRWISTLLFFSLLLILIPLLKLSVPREKMVDSPVAIFFVLLLLCQYVYICLHVIKRDRFIIDLSDKKSVLHDSYYVKKCKDPTYHQTNCLELATNKTEKGEPVVGSKVYYPDSVTITDGNKEGRDVLAPYLKKNVLSRDSFDTFMKVEKPYLNPDLRITDLVDMLHLNRTYISSFINREYGVNFSVFINRCRLMEYSALKEMPEYSKMNKSELAELAGFNSFRSFQRTKKEVSESKKEGLRGVKIFFNL